jgi:hypothetical protein
MQNLQHFRAKARVQQIQPRNKRDKFGEVKALKKTQSNELQVSKLLLKTLSNKKSDCVKKIEEFRIQ